MIRHIDAIFLPVLNLEESLEWYKKYFGVKVNWRDREGWNAAGVSFEFGGMVLLERELINQSDHIRFNLYTPDVAFSYRHLKENGVEVNKFVQYDDMDCFDFKDSSGNWIGIVGCWKEEGVEQGEYGGPDAVFLPVSDIKKATEWYHSLFGFQYHIATDLDPQYPFRYGFNRIGSDRNHPRGFSLVETPKRYPTSHIPFNMQTEDIEKVHRYLKEKGVTVTDIMDSGTFLWFNFTDLDGNELGFVEGGRS
ncbi:MAG TPA: VOC family protein [Bacillales bacterium]|nr:VOC family protein [Bacillales bacterium]